MSTFGAVFFLLIIILASSSTFTCYQIVPAAHANGCSNNDTAADGIRMWPSIDQKNTSMLLMMNETRRKLGSFQICAPCTCCGGARGYCLLSPCCYTINCNIPNRPFGFCSFTPKSCNCFGCHL